MSQAGQIVYLTAIETLTGNTGGYVEPALGNINILGVGNITVNNPTGLPGSAELDIILSGSVPDSFVTNSGTAIPALGVLNVLGSTNISTIGSADTINIDLATSITLPATSADTTSGVIFIGTNLPVLQTYGTNNIFVGRSGNFTLSSAANNVAIGLSGTGLTTGSNNVLIGSAGINYTSESGNICISNPGTVSDAHTTRIGTYGTGPQEQTVAYVAGVVHGTNGLIADAGDVTSTAGNLVATAGNLMLPTTTSTTGQINIDSVPVFQTYGTNNVFVGATAGNLTLTTANATSNTALGYGALTNLSGTVSSTSYGNTAIGRGALHSAANPTACIAIGYSAGTNYTTTESSNITIQNTGVVGESNTLRLGGGTGTETGQLNAAYISGIYGSTVGTNGQVALIDSTDLLGTITSSSSGYVLTSNGSSSAPSFQSVGTAIGATQYALQVGNSSGGLASLSVGSSGYVLTGGGASANPGWIQYLGVASGGIGVGTLTAHGLLIGESTSAISATSSGSAGQIITSGGASADPSWTTATYPATVATGDILSATGTNTIGVIAGTSATSGYVLTGNGSGVAPTWKVASGGGMTWTSESGATVAMAVNNGYINANSGLTTLTLPATAVVGASVAVAGLGAGGWLIAQNSGQTINFGSSPTTTGTGGYIASTNLYDSVTLLCIVANTTWSVLSAVGNLTVL